MSSVHVVAEAKKAEKYLSELETANRKLLLENSQLRASHSYRLGLALVSFAKRRSLRALPILLKDIKQALKAELVQTPESQKRPILRWLDSSPTTESDPLQKLVEARPVGSQMIARLGKQTSRAAMVGIMSGDTVARLGKAVGLSHVPFDSYDASWQEKEITHLVIDVDELAYAFGWENAFTLREPAATVEMVVMLQKARLAGIVTILVLPALPNRYPLLSRSRAFFDREFARVDLTLEAVLAVTRRASAA